MKVRFADVAGVRTRYYYEGTGPALFLLHGVGIAADSWMRNIDPLAADFFVCAPDMLGSGFTECGDYRGGPPQPYLIEHLEQLVDHLGIERFSLAGSSLGALLAALIYLRMPRRIEKLILIGSGSLFGTDETQMKAGIERSYRNGRTAFGDPTFETCRKRMANLVFDPASIPDELILMQLTCHALPWALESYQYRMEGLMDFERGREFLCGGRLGELRVPVLVIWGRDDPRGNYDQAMRDFTKLPSGNVVTFERCGHTPHLEHPALFNCTVRDFLVS